MDATKRKKCKVVKDCTYTYPKYRLMIPLKVGDEYIVVGFTRHKGVLCYILQDANDDTSVKFPVPENHFKKYFSHE